jgi:hypothetical protein
MGTMNKRTVHVYACLAEGSLVGFCTEAMASHPANAASALPAAAHVVCYNVPEPCAFLTHG